MFAHIISLSIYLHYLCLTVSNDLVLFPLVPLPVNSSVPEASTSMNTPHGAPVLQLRPGWGPVQGGTSLIILHHKDFGSNHDILMGGLPLAG